MERMFCVVDILVVIISDDILFDILVDILETKPNKKGDDGGDVLRGRYFGPSFTLLTTCPYCCKHFKVNIQSGSRLRKYSEKDKKDKKGTKRKLILPHRLTLLETFLSIQPN